MKNIKSKIFISVISILSLCSFLIGTSVAWLSSKTAEVINTFTYGDINITIKETDTNDKNITRRVSSVTLAGSLFDFSCY